MNHLTKDEIYVVFAALLTMVQKYSGIQDNMTEEQWKLAEKLLVKFQALVEDP